MKTEPPKEFATKVEALQHIADIALAMKEGKKIQFYCTVSNVWGDCFGVHDLSSNPHLFRVKPEPREWWEWRTAQGALVERCTSLESARTWRKNFNAEGGRLFKVTEVIE